MPDIEILKQAEIFTGLGEDQLQKIARAGEKKKVADGELVFREGERGHEVYIVLDGRIQITVEMSLPTEQAPVHTVTEGKVFGEFALVSDHERSASARAIKDTEVFAFSRESFLKLADEDPHLGYKVLHELGQILVGRLIKTTKELRSSLMF